MAVAFHRPNLPDQPVAGDVLVTPRLYWDETKTRLLREGDPDARFLAYAEGTVVPVRLAEELGLAEFLADEPQPEQFVAADVPEKPRRQSRQSRRADRQLAPGVVADTSIDGEANVLVPEPGSPLRNGVDK